MSNNRKDALSRNIARQLLALFDRARALRVDIFARFADGSDDSDIAWNDVSWASLYEVPLEEFSAELFGATESIEEIQNIFLRGDAVDAFTITENAIAEQQEEHSQQEGDNACLGSTAMVFASSIESLGVFGATMDELISRARGGDDSALFQAILIDRAVVSGPTAARRIQKAELSGDEKFFDVLSRTLKRSYPSRPEPKNDRARFVLEIFRRWWPQLEMTKSELDLIIVNELQAYGTGKEDAMEGIAALRKRFFSKRVKDTK